MNDESQSPNLPKTSISPMLSVRRGAKAVEFYKAAFDARELFRIGDEPRSLGFVPARLGEHVDLRRLPAELRRVNAGLHLELLQCIDGRHDYKRVEVGVRVLHAVQRVVVEICALARDGNSLLLRPRGQLVRSTLRNRCTGWFSFASVYFV